MVRFLSLTGTDAGDDVAMYIWPWARLVWSGLVFHVVSLRGCLSTREG
jgi:hypothetical protein